MNTTPYLTSERLAFFAPTLADEAFFTKVQTDDALMAYMGAGTRTAEGAKMLLMQSVYHQQLFGFSLGTVALKETNEKIGQAGVYHFNLDENDPRIEIAFAFFESFWHQGYGTEAVQALQNWSARQLNNQKLFAVVNPQNRPSLKVLRKCGFQFKKNTQREKVKAQLWAWAAKTN